MPSTGRAGQPEVAPVIMIDLRASAAGPDAAAPGSIGERTLEERQRGQPGGGTGSPPGWRIVNVERLLVVDDAGAFAGHEDDYRHLIEAPTFGRMLCLVIGDPADPPYLDLPKAVDAVRAPVLWLGDSRGVGWRIGWATTTRLAYSVTDPDGSAAVADLIGSLTSPGVFDEVARAISGLPGRTGVPALLPWARWPPGDRDGAGPGPHLESGKPAGSAPGATAMPAAPGPRDGHRAIRRWPVASLLLALAGAVIAAVTLLAIRPGRPGAGFAAAGAAAVLLGLLAIAWRTRVLSVLRRPARVPAPSPSPEPPAGELPIIATPQSREVLARARWMMGASLADEAFRQLSSPEQLVMLGGDPELARLVRFAPASTRSLIGHAVEGDSVLWTPAGDQLGVIRLVPMKAGLVRPGGA